MESRKWSTFDGIPRGRGIILGRVSNSCTSQPIVNHQHSHSLERVAANKVHDAMIYGMDWYWHSDYELPICSLDKTVTLCDTKRVDRDEGGPLSRLLSTIQTNYPILYMAGIILEFGLFKSSL